MEFLNDTNIVVAIAFVIFVAILLKVKVPGIVGKMLDERADKIKADIDEARSLREEAQSLLASYERKQKEVQGQVDRIVATARDEAQAAAAQAQEELKRSIARRLQSAEDQIASAEASATKDVRDRAVAVAMAAAREAIARNLGEADRNGLIDHAIDEVGAKLH